MCYIKYTIVVITISDYHHASASLRPFATRTAVLQGHNLVTSFHILWIPTLGNYDHAGRGLADAEVTKCAQFIIPCLLAFRALIHLFTLFGCVVWCCNSQLQPIDPTTKPCWPYLIMHFELDKKDAGRADLWKQILPRHDARQIGWVLSPLAQVGVAGGEDSQENLPTFETTGCFGVNSGLEPGRFLRLMMLRVTRANRKTC